MFCSGGADSTVLLRLAHRETRGWGTPLLVVHLAHALRGAESAAERRFVADLAEELGCGLHIEEAPLPKALVRRHGVQGAARALRLSLLERLRGRHPGWLFAFAHHADDLAETVLGRIIEGCGPAGLVGMSPKRGDVIRPLLGLRRSQLRALAAAEDWAFCEDSSNDSLRYRRNRIRHELLPALRSVAPAVDRALTGLSRRVARDEAFFEQLLLPERARWGRAWGFARGFPGGLPDALVLRLLAPRLRALGRIGAGHLEAALALVHEGRGALDLPGGRCVWRRGRLWILPAPLPAPPAPLSLCPGLSRRWPLLGRIERATVPAREVDPTRSGAGWGIAWFDAERLPGPLQIRLAQPEDVLLAYGFARPRSVITLLNEAGWPRAARPLAPVVVAGKVPIWVPLGRASRIAVVTERTQHVVRLSLELPGLVPN